MICHRHLIRYFKTKHRAPTCVGADAPYASCSDLVLYPAQSEAAAVAPLPAARVCQLAGKHSRASHGKLQI